MLVAYFSVLCCACCCNLITFSFSVRVGVFFIDELFIFLSDVYIVRSILVVNFDLFHKALDGF
ncbi:hypothetical protein LPMST01_17245 [Salmonella enterica subsp. enterica serovar Infantis]|nr:hypothetical protein LPMST01_17245 [Salmonella enterica subsp. enterica serovar Infantis]